MLSAMTVYYFFTYFVFLELSFILTFLLFLSAHVANAKFSHPSIFLAARLESPLDLTNCIIHTLNLLFTSSSTRSIINSVTPKFKFKLIRFIYSFFFFLLHDHLRPPFNTCSIFIYYIDNTNIFIQLEIN